MADLFSSRARAFISRIPRGRVTTYGIIAELAGNRCGARQVARVLHACSARDGLPWHRVVNRRGRISLPPDNGGRLQEQLLLEEGVVMDDQGRIDFRRYLWTGPAPF